MCSKASIAASGRQRTLLVGELRVGKRKSATAIAQASPGTSAPLFVDGEFTAQELTNIASDFVADAQKVLLSCFSESTGLLTRCWHASAPY